MIPPNPISREHDLYTLWETHALAGAQVVARDGERIVVVSQGDRNVGPGPDYSGAVLLINGVLMTGPVEMHRSEREWFEHGHHRDAAYGDVILHLVGECDPRRKLAMPTIDAGTLAGLSADGEPARDPDDIPPATLTPDFLAELSWARLLRRATEIIRAEPERAGDDRIRRALVRRMFDALGYSANRAPMGSLAEGVLARESELVHASFDDVAAVVLCASGVDRARITAAASGFMSESRLHSILKNHDLPEQVAEWRYDTRPANAPERRLWGAARLIFDIYHNDLLARLYRAIELEKLQTVIRLLTVRFGSSTFVGADRVREIVINAVLPVSLAAGIGGRNAALVAGACQLYRRMPVRATNHVVRRIEERYLAGVPLHGAFWQQGAIEFHQRYLLPDRSALSFVAESGFQERRAVR